MSRKEPKPITADEYIKAMFTDFVEIPPNAFTIEDVLNSQNHLSRSGVVRRLNDRVRSGELSKVRGKRNDKFVNYYVPTNK